LKETRLGVGLVSNSNFLNGDVGITGDDSELRQTNPRVNPLINSLTKLDCRVCQTGLSGFGSSNSAASFVKFQNHLFTPPLGDIKGLSLPKWCRLLEEDESKNKRTKISESGAYTSSSN
jgi:hypothetical protein